MLRQFIVEGKDVCLMNGAWTVGYSYKKKLWPLPHSTHKNQFEMDPTP